MNVIVLEEILLSLESGSRPKGGASRLGNGVFSLGAEHLDNKGGFNLSNSKFIPREHYSSMRLGVVSRNNILVVKDGATTGKVSFVGESFSLTEAAINEHLFLLKIDETKALPKYVFYHLFSPIGQSQILRNFRGATVGGIARSFVQKVSLPLPSLKDQLRIAAILDKADAVRQKRQQAIALTEELLRSAFLEMFGDPVTNPKRWNIVNLKSQIAELRYGTSVKCNDIKENDDLPILRIPNIIGEQISWNDVKYAELETKEVTKLLLKPGDILFVRTNGNPEYIGRCALFEEGYGDTLYASYLIRARLKPNARLYPAFIRDIISFPTYRSHLVREARTTAGNYNINTEGLGRLRLIEPPLKEQEIYIQFGQKLNAHVKKQKSQLEETNSFFNSLLQRAFRGEL